jgi:hypothetical protein
MGAFPQTGQGTVEGRAINRHRFGIAARITALVVGVLAFCIAASPAGAKALTAKQIANQVLKLDPRKPSDINLFTSKFVNGADGLYPQGTAMHPVSGLRGPARDPATRWRR